MGFAKLRSTERKIEYLFSPEDYLKFERAAETRHEYIDGEVFEMAGESDNHPDISQNLAGVFYNSLKNKPCRARMKDTKVRSGNLEQNIFPPKGMFSYPDMVIICGKPEHHDQLKDIVTNPQVIIEVLSPSTELFDRNTKFERYRRYNESLSDYLLVSQDKPQVEHFVRQGDGSWVYWIYEGLETKFSIASIECEIAMTDIYERIEFEQTEIIALD